MSSALYLMLRDLAKDIRDRINGVRARLFWLERGKGSSVSIHARLDIMKRPDRPTGRFRLGKKSFVETRAVINSWIGDVTVGNRSGVGIGSILIGPIHIGDDCRISQNCFVCAENRKRQQGGILSSDDFDIRPITIGDRVWIGTGAIILPGVTIGDDATIGAGSVVSKDIPAGSVVVGPAAKPLSNR